MRMMEKVRAGRTGEGKLRRFEDKDFEWKMKIVDEERIEK